MNGHTIGFTIIYTIMATLFFLVIAKYDIHMFQLASYRNSRYFRWLYPKNIFSAKRTMALLMIVPALVPHYVGIGFATAITLVALYNCFKATSPVSSVFPLLRSPPAPMVWHC